MLALKNRHCELCIDVFVSEACGGGKACGVWDPTGGDNQQWFMKACGDGYFCFMNPANDCVLDCYVDEEYNGEGRQVGAWEFNGGDNQLWYLEAAEDDGWMCIRNKHNDMALDVDMGSAVGDGGDGHQLIVWPHHGNDNQQWGWGDSVMIKNMWNNMVLDLFVDDNNIGVWEPTGGENQRWKIRPSGEGSFLLVNVMEGSMVLDEVTDSEYNGCGRKVGAWGRNEGPNQQWKLEPSDEPGQYILVNVNSGKALDIDADSEVGDGGAGKQVITWDKHGNDNQKWMLAFFE